MKFFSLMPAAVTAAGIRSKSIELERAIDSARRGMPIDPEPIMKQLASDLALLAKQTKEPRRAAA